jgi:NAD-dependent DNA ligase
MPDFDIEKEIRRLKVSIWFHRCLYYILDDPIILDYEYDDLERRLRNLEAVSLTIDLDSPSYAVGYDPPDYLRPKVENLVHYYLEKVKPKNTQQNV